MKLLGSLLLIITLLFQHEVAAKDNNKVLIVLTSHSDLGNTGNKTGFWLAELTHPYYEFKHAGFEVDIASIEGGMAPLDKKSFSEPDPYHQKFLQDAELMAKVIRSIPLSQIDPTHYRAVVFSGGSGPMWDFPNNPDIQRIANDIFQTEGVVAAVCHGNAALVNIKLPNGRYLVEGKKVAAFSNKEEADLGTTDIVPFLLQDKLIERGAIYLEGNPWQKQIAIDGRLITGQNPASATPMAKAIIQQLTQ